MLADPSALLTKKEVCDKLRIARRTFERFARRTRLRPVPTLGLAFLYDPAAIESAIVRDFQRRLKHALDVK